MNITQLEEQVVQSVERLSESVVVVGKPLRGRSIYPGLAPLDSQGTGIIIGKTGEIVTNNHVVDGAVKVEVGLKDGRTFEGRVVGSDAATDIALVKVEADDFPAARLAPSDNLKVGQIVLAIGNALGLPGAPTVSMGVISAIGRPLPGSDFVLEGLIQTDAAINPGNSGGPLANLNGEVIGMNTAVIPHAQGVGFAIPSDTVKAVTSQIIERGRVVRPWLGITGISLNAAIARRYDLSVDSGILVYEVSSYSPARRAGLRPGDVIVALEEDDIKDMKTLIGALSRFKVGEMARISFVRIDARYTTSISLEEAPLKALLRGG